MIKSQQKGKIKLHFADGSLLRRDALAECHCLVEEAVHEGHSETESAPPERNNNKKYKSVVVVIIMMILCSSVIVTI